MRLGRTTVILCAAMVARQAWAHNFVGAQACGTCHTFEYRVWSQSPHARAHQSLTQSQLADARCNSCHTTVTQSALTDSPAGTALQLREPRPESLIPDGIAAGPPAPRTQQDSSSSPAAPTDIDQKFLGVQCEACHGPGAIYQPEYVMRDRELSRWVGLVEQTPQVCQGCHSDSSPALVPFDFKSAWARIDHGREARLAYEAAMAKQEPGVPAPPEPASPSHVQTRSSHGPRPTKRQRHHHLRSRKSPAGQKKSGSGAD